MWPRRKSIMLTQWNLSKNSGHWGWGELPGWWTHWCTRRMTHLNPSGWTRESSVLRTLSSLTWCVSFCAWAWIVCLIIKLWSLIYHCFEFCMSFYWIIKPKGVTGNLEFIFSWPEVQVNWRFQSRRWYLNEGSLVGDHDLICWNLQQL